MNVLLIYLYLCNCTHYTHIYRLHRI